MQFSAIRKYCLEKDHRFKEEDFKIVGRFRTKGEAFLGEKFLIESKKPSLNTKDS